MDIENLVIQLRQEVTRITQAIAALEALDKTGARRRGRPKLGQSTQVSISGRRTMSPAARAKIAAAQRARWARQRAGATKTKDTPTKTRARRRMSPAARKKISAAMKARWAAREKQSRRKAA